LIKYPDFRKLNKSG